MPRTSETREALAEAYAVTRRTHRGRRAAHDRLQQITHHELRRAVAAQRAAQRAEQKQARAQARAVADLFEEEHA